MNTGRTRLRICAGLFGLGIAFSGGCAWNEWGAPRGWHAQFRAPLPTLNPEEDAVAQLDVATMRWRLGEPLLEKEVWTELDEQFITLEQKRLFAQHGLRVGLMRAANGTRLQAMLADPKLAKPAANSVTEGFIRWWTYVGDKLVEAPRPLPPCTIEARRVVARAEHDLFWPLGEKGASARLLWPNAAETSTKSFTDVELGLSVHLQKLPDGLTRVSLIPAVKHSLQPEGNSDIFLETLRKQNGMQFQEDRLDALELDVTLAQDQYLVITTQPSDKAAQFTGSRTWGELAFAEAQAGQQIMLVVRGASVAGPRIPEPPQKGEAWPLAWQTADLVQPVKTPPPPPIP